MNALLLLGAVVLIFVAVCVLRAIGCVRQTKAEADAMKRWWAERAAIREESSIADDSPEQEGEPRA